MQTSHIPTFRPLASHGSRALCLAAWALLVHASASAFSQGSPICQVNSLPLLQMASALSSPPPTGWVLEAESTRYAPGTASVLRISNADPLVRAKGILLWSLTGPGQGAGRFELPTSGDFQYVPAPAQCGEWAITHTEATAKDQSELIFLWQPPASGSVIIRAFIIEDCGDTRSCRAHQALTPILGLSPSLILFSDGFEN